VGGGDIWGINADSQIFRFNFSTLLFDQIGGTLTQITVGPNAVWGLATLGLGDETTATKDHCFIVNSTKGEMLRSMPPSKRMITEYLGE
jgi:hypothetical protein